MFTTAADAKTYALAGHATLTLTSQRTGARYTFKINQAEDDNGEPKSLWFVSLLTGPDNHSDYAYLGVINNGFRTTAKSKFAADSIPARAFAYFWKHVDAERMAPDLEVRHEGACGRCGRKLTVDTSIDKGIGPECERIMGGL
jgi:hypothetical protein